MIEPISALPLDAAVDDALTLDPPLVDKWCSPLFHGYASQGRGPVMW